MNETANTTETHEVWFAIPAVYNAGEWRISKQVIGKRGGKSWKALTHGIPATGGSQQMFLTPGLYKENYWVNGWCQKSLYEVTVEGDLIQLDD